MSSPGRALCGRRPRSNLVFVAALVSFLRLDFAASAASSVPSARHGRKQFVPRDFIRQEQEVEEEGGAGPDLLELASRHVALGKESMMKKKGGGAAPPICGDDPVGDTCRLLRRGDKKTEPMLSVSFAQLQSALNECKGSSVQPLGAVQQLLKTLKLESAVMNTTGRLEDRRVACDDLCDASLEYFKSMRSYVVPPASDTTCYRHRDGGLSCGISVDPDVVSTEMGKNKYFGGDKAENKANSVVRSPSTVNVHGTGISVDDCPFHDRHSVIRIAQLFRYYPRKIDNDRIDMPPAVSAVDQKLIYINLAKAEAWVALTLRAMINHGTAAAERKEFFGGEGPLKKDEVRNVIWKVLAFALRVFMDGIHVKLPGAICSKDVLAYVWAPQRSSGFFSEGALPCLESMHGECGIGPDDRYHVQICAGIFKQPEPDFVSVFVHEVVHHAGPIDVTYKVKTLKKKLTQSQQLNNAANYQRYFLEVVTDEREAWRQFKQVWINIANNFKRRRANRKAKKAKKRAKKTGKGGSR